MNNISPNQRKRRRFYWLAAALQLVVILIIVFWRVSILSSGTTVLLDCTPIDPRSLFSGDYVILDFNIGKIPDDIFINPPLIGETVYVALEPESDSPFHHAVQAAIDPDSLDTDTKVFIRGTRKSGFWKQPYISVKYGIENYFVPQSEGRKIEQTDSADIHAEIAISKAGHAALKRLFIDGREVRFR